MNKFMKSDACKMIFIAVVVLALTAVVSLAAAACKAGYSTLGVLALAMSAFWILGTLTHYAAQLQVGASMKEWYGGDGSGKFLPKASIKRSAGIVFVFLLGSSAFAIAVSLIITHAPSLL